MSKASLLPVGVHGTKSTALYPDTSDPFSFGLRPDQDHLLLGPHPEDPMAAETMNVWVHDGDRNTGFNIHAQMQNGEMRAPVTVFLPDGRILRIRTDTPAAFTDPARPHTQHVRYACEQPFRKWRFEIDDLPVWVTNKDELSNGVVADETPTTKVSIVAEATMLSPAWLQGTLLAEAYEAVAETPAGIWIAARVQSGMTSEAFRFEQAIVAEGEIRFEGETFPFKGYGLRGHVRGTRIMGGMDGHTWLSGATPGGTAFGLLSFPRPEGGFHFSEAFLFRNGVLYPSRARYAPPMSYDPDQGEYVIELVNDQLGLTRITGRDERLFWWSMAAWGSQQAPRWGLAPDAQMVMRQALARFEIDGETAFGMNERSGPRP
jgi:hypothetical protein